MIFLPVVSMIKTYARSSVCKVIRAIYLLFFLSSSSVFPRWPCLSSLTFSSCQVICDDPIPSGLICLKILASFLTDLSHSAGTAVPWGAGQGRINTDAFAQLHVPTLHTLLLFPCTSPASKVACYPAMGLIVCQSNSGVSERLTP